MKRVSLFVFTCALAACRGSDEPSESPSSERSASDDAESAESPPDLDTIASLLRARHAEDLPSAADLEKYPSAEASLQQLARAGETMVVRTRALRLLEHYPSDASHTLLVEIAGGTGHPALRAAAIEGLASQPLDRLPDTLALVSAALEDGDPRIGLAAVATLDRTSAGKQALAQAKSTGNLSEQVRAAIDARAP